MVEVFLGIGSNQGDSAAVFAELFGLMAQDCPGLRVSPLYKTAPRYVTDQPPFLNCVAACLTDKSPLAFLDYTQGLEARFGRNRAVERRYGERPLDIDIILWGNEIIDEPRLSVPHALLHERKFALLPLLDLAPSAVDPRDGVAWREKYQKLEPQGIYYSSLARYS
jgi:2-amino-4-hydroxy-6-hydroxymethyldihydropteridine diphosphokinase